MIHATNTDSLNFTVSVSSGVPMTFFSTRWEIGVPEPLPMNEVVKGLKAIEEDLR